ncbi:MAG: alpha/beta fold hydrolase [Paracoccaceae bacterium]|nr:alpha/beta fold hydrolase [Paracoccaceae bacterium]
MDWARERATWPLAEHSRFIDVRPHRWHVQSFGEGPVALLLHGAGGATQSFRALAPVLATRFRVVMMDYPGQGFTRMGTRQRCGLGPLTEDIAALLEHLGSRPDLMVGHSAGAAVALNLAGRYPAAPVVGINPALGHFEGAAGWLFPILAKALAATPLVPRLFSALARRPGQLAALLSSTGSRLDPAGTALYRRLIEDADHVEGTLLMMAQWSIDGLLAELPSLAAPVLFLIGERDGTVPPKVGRTAAARLGHGRVVGYPSAGHLVHETDPDAVTEAIFGFFDAEAPQLSRA